ncbi:MAG TPA: tetratricopeptide repeat protein [Sphingomicrobium sp.]|jgi:Flp pilus assembly protein TadD|nr:tetratricopeptide repeat protein [Sphingomicrobium sp.]
MGRSQATACFYLAIGISLLSGGLLAGCQGVEPTAFGDTKEGLKSVADVEYFSSDQAVAAGKNQFREKNYGNAEAAFQKAVELAPNDGEAWIGLAASYDRLRRFDLADRAYDQAFHYLGGTYQFYNNRGYSFLLRGDLVKARRDFLKAYELDPRNQVVANNLELLGSSAKSVKR